MREWELENRGKMNQFREDLVAFSLKNTENIDMCDSWWGFISARRTRCLPFFYSSIENSLIFKLYRILSLRSESNLQSLGGKVEEKF
jgi:hypothetical protein